MTIARPTATAEQGMVAAPHALAAEAGLAILQEGGSAIDAVVAANAVLTVVYPDQTSIGGDCFLLYYEAATGKLHGLNGSGRAPRAADRSALRAAGYATMPARGIFSVTVPGTIDAWAVALERFGRFGFDRLLRPAIALASEGFPVSAHVSANLGAAIAAEQWSDAFYATYLPGGRVPQAGERLPLPDLAASLKVIARDGPDAFYRGPIAEAIVATSDRLGGWLSLEDLATHRAEWVEPVTTDYRGTTLAEMPPNSQGLTALIELNLVEPVEPAAWGSSDHLHPLIEAKKLAFAVRDAELTDPSFATIDIDRLTSKAFARRLWRAYDPARAGDGSAALVGDTVYLCAVDRDGNAASIIQSIYLSFGSGVIADGTGILLQCRGAYFSLADDHVNRLEPGKRTLHTLMPAMLLRDGELLGPIGTQGGDAQAQVHLQLVTNLIDHGMDPQAAIDAPRWVAGGPRGSSPYLVGLEAGFPAETIDGLAARGHLIQAAGQWNPFFGHAQMILRDRERGLLLGAADPRADGAALGY